MENLLRITKLLENESEESTWNGIIVNGTEYIYGEHIESECDVDGDKIVPELLYVDFDNDYYKVSEIDVEDILDREEKQSILKSDKYKEIGTSLHKINKYAKVLRDEKLADVDNAKYYELEEQIKDLYQLKEKVISKIIGEGHTPLGYHTFKVGREGERKILMPYIEIYEFGFHYYSSCEDLKELGEIEHEINGECDFDLSNIQEDISLLTKYVKKGA